MDVHIITNCHWTKTIIITATHVVDEKIHSIAIIYYIGPIANSN